MSHVELGRGVFARIRAHRGQREQLVVALQPLIDSGAAEEGTIAYILHESVDDPDSIWFYAQFRDQRALEIHRDNEQALLGDLVKVAEYLSEITQVEQGVVRWHKSEARTEQV